jgi:hypothetical protein
MEHLICNIIRDIPKILDTYSNWSQRRENRRQQINNASHEVRLGFEDIIKNLKNRDHDLVANNLREKIINIEHSIENLKNLDPRRFDKFSASLKLLCRKIMDDMDKPDGLIDKDKYLSLFKNLQDKFDPRQSKIEINSSSVRKRLPFIGYILLLNHFVVYPYAIIVQRPKLIGSINPFNLCWADAFRQSADTVINDRLIDSLENAKPYLHKVLYQSTSNQSNADEDTSITAVKLSKRISDRINRLRSQKMNPDISNTSLPILESSLPLVNILANNETIDKMKTNNEYNQIQGDEPRIYTIAILVPITNGLQDPVSQSSKLQPPFSWSLGVLRGIDIAQKAMLSQSDSGNKVLLRALIVNDNNHVNSDQNKDLLLSIARNVNVVGLIGHNQYQSISNISTCFHRENLPMITTSLPAMKTLDQMTYSLLPPIPVVASVLVQAIERQREKGGSRYNSKPELSIFYNSVDLASQILSNEICAQARRRRDWPCVEIDVSNVYKIPPSTDNIKMEWVVAFNPHIGNLEKNRERIKSIVRSFGISNKKSEIKGWIFLSPDVLDEYLEDSLKLALCNIFKPTGSCSQPKEARKKLNSLPEDQDFDILRIAPRDWRSDGNINKNHEALMSDHNNPFYDRRNNLYGRHLNWQVYNSYNAMMAFRDLIDGDDPGDVNKNVGILRGSIVDRFSGKSKDNGSKSIDLTVPNNLTLDFPYEHRSSTDLCLVSLIRSQYPVVDLFCTSD